MGNYGNIFNRISLYVVKNGCAQRHSNISECGRREVRRQETGVRIQDSEWEPVNQQAKIKDVVLNDTPRSRNAEARECGSEKLAQLAGPATAGEKSEKSCERWKCRNACKTEQCCAQRHSKISECGRREVRIQNGNR